MVALIDIKPKGQALSHGFIPVLVLLVFFAMQAVLSMRQKSVTTDEMVYITAGYYHLHTFKFDFNNTNPPLPKILTALPLLVLNPALPAMDSDPAFWNEIKQWQYARSFMYENRIDADTMLFWARIPIVVLGIILGIFVFLWSYQLYGRQSGLIALFLYALSPNILAHTRLATQDLALTAFMFIAAYSFWTFVHRPSLIKLFWCGLTFSAAALSKTTGFFLAPMALIYSAILVLNGSQLGVWNTLPIVKHVDPVRVRLRQLVSFAIAFAGIGVIAILLLNAGYLFQGSFQPISEFVPVERILTKFNIESGLLIGLMDAITRIPSPFPAPFMQLLEFQASRVAHGNTIYLAGEISRTGWWYLMPVALLIKTPIPLLLILAIALYQLVRSGTLSSAEWLAVTVISFVIALFMYLKSVNIGLRYVLPIFPFLYVLASRMVRDEFKPKFWVKAGLVVMLIWYAFGTVRIYPHYLAYFNEFIGGPRNGYKYLADSFLDWGQDLKGLKTYLDENDIKKIKLAYFGSADAGYYGIDYDYLPSVGLAPRVPGDKWWYEIKSEDLPPLDLTGGHMAVSATLLAGVFLPGYYSALRDFEPVDQIGYSILIYDLGKQEPNLAVSPDREVEQ